MKNPCNNCGNFKLNTPYDYSQCAWCWAIAHTNKYKNTQSQPSPQAPKIILPCIHQGIVKYRARCMCPRKDTYVCEAGLGDKGLCVPLLHCGPDICSNYEPDNNNI